MIKNLPAKAGNRFDPWSGQISLSATTTEPVPTREAQTPQLVRSLCSPQPEKAHGQQQRPSTAKKTRLLLC